MPKATFFNLPEEKQNHLMDSAMKEFSSVPLYKASVSNIVKAANIPRGSFYQYFKDKEDIFYYLLETKTRTHNQYFIELLKKSNGDIFEAFLETFRIMVKEFQDKKKRAFYKNVFMNMNYKMENTLSMDISEPDFEIEFEEIKEFINIDKLNVTDESEMIHVVQIMIATTMQNLMFSFTKQYTEDVSLKNYKIELNLLKKGLYIEH